MTADREWRPRGPRFIPLAAIPFIVAALIPVVLSWEDWLAIFPADPIGWLSTAFLGVIPNVAVPLMGAAIVIRHPRAHRTVPLLLFGATLLTIQIAGLLLVGPILELLTDPSSFPDEPNIKLYQAVFLMATIISAFGWAYLASGLVRARRNEDVGGGWVMVLIAIAVAVAVISTAAQAGAQSPLLGVGTDVLQMALVAAILVTGFAEKLAIGYMAVTATRGWLAHEQPRHGWGLAATGTWLLLCGLIVVSVVPLLGEDWMQVYDASWVLIAVSLAFAGGATALLVAFALGLPDVDGITWYDLAELDAAAARASGQARDPFDDSTASDEAELFELEDRRLDR
jgi:hypothetical protein